MKKKWLMLFGLSVLPSLLLAMGEDGKAEVTPTYNFFGNTPRTHNVDLSTTNIVLLSSRASDATIETDSFTSLGILSWRFREIINVSTCAALAISDRSSPPWNVYSTTYSVILASGPLGAGDVYDVPHQDQVWGIWTAVGASAGACAAGAGAVVSENYQNQNRRR